MSEFDDLLGKGKAKKGGGRKKASALRWDPETGEKKRVTRDDDEWDEWLTAAQYKKAQKEAKADDDDDDDDSGVKKFAKDVAKDVLKDLKKPTRGNRRAKRRIAQDVADVTNKGGKSLLTKVAPLALRIGGVSVALGLAWWGIKTLEARAVRKRVEAEIARTEASLKRPLTDRELAALLPQYETWFKKQMPTQKVIAKGKDLLTNTLKRKP